MVNVRGNGARARRGVLWGALFSSTILTIAACDGEGGGGPGGGVGPGGAGAAGGGGNGKAGGSGANGFVGEAPHPGETASREAFLAAYSGVVCAMYAPCCEATSTGFDQAGCEHWVTGVQGAFWQGDFHADVADTCLAQLRGALADPQRCATVSYDDATFETICADAFTTPSRGGAPPGAACDQDADCDPPPKGAVECALGVCRATVPTKEVGASPCGPSPVVPSPPGIVYACDSQAGLWCDRGAAEGAGVCAAKVGDGAFCPFANACDETSLCVGGVCHALPTAGEACLNGVPGAGGFCAAGHACNPSTLVCEANPTGGDDTGRACNTDADCLSQRCEGKKCLAYDFTKQINCGK
jgi:hypothetical protein